MNAYFYGSKTSINDATRYYVNLITSVLAQRGYKIIFESQIKKIKKPDLIFTITERDFVIAKFYYPITKTIFWSQGVAAEEALGNKITFASIKLWAKKMIEVFIALHFSSVVFLISERMRKRYIHEYLYLKKNNIIMPCYNLQLSNDFSINRYQLPSFVYAGAFLGWQCVPEMLKVFSNIEKKLPNAKLTILSKDKESFIKAITEYEIKNYEIKYVPQEKLNDELKKYKYGFLIRHNTIINQVATPTKMNSYLSNYIIPIFTDAVDDFKKNIDLGEFTLCYKCPFNEEVISKDIINFENKKLDYVKYKKYVKNIFMNHYNDSKHTIAIHKIFNKYSIGKQI
ncbi:MAG: hypothetical protein J6L02_08415 [Bacteroidales bacterium]|nr:hypothetical protein [Bacteroidales bacterium]